MSAVTQAMLTPPCPSFPRRSQPQPRRRRRVVTLVNMEHHQQGREGEEDAPPAADDDFVLLPGEGLQQRLGYRDADYDTDAGVAATRPRAVRAAIDMERDTGRSPGLVAGRSRAGDSSDGGGEGEPQWSELMLLGRVKVWPPCFDFCFWACLCQGKHMGRRDLRG